MATNRMQVRALASALLIAALAAPAPLTGRAAEAKDNKIGRWKLRAEAPAQGTREYEDRGCGVTVSTRKGVNARGQEYYSSYAAKVDGKEYPRLIKGSNAVTTIAFTQVDPDTSFWILGASLVVRGVGLGFTMMPAMAAAYATIGREQVPRATPMLNVVQRVGGSLGTAILAVVLQNQLTSQLGASASGPPAAGARLPAQQVATAFAHTYWWAMAITAVAVVPAVVLARTQRAARREAAAAGGATRAPAPTVG